MRLLSFKTEDDPTPRLLNETIVEYLDHYKRGSNTSHLSQKQVIQSMMDHFYHSHPEVKGPLGACEINQIHENVFQPLLITCIEFNWWELFSELLEDALMRKADIEAVQSEGGNLLIWLMSSRFNRLLSVEDKEYHWMNKAAERLLSMGFSPYELDSSEDPHFCGRSAAEWAIRSENLQGLKLILPYYAIENFQRDEPRMKTMAGQSFQSKEILFLLDECERRLLQLEVQSELLSERLNRSRL